MMIDSVHTVESPEGITLVLRPAGLVSRALAYLIDFAIRGAVLIGVSIIAAMIGALGAALMLITYFLLEWFYPVVFELSRGSATPGKRIMGLQVVLDSGLPVTPAASVVRNLLRAADFLPVLYAFGCVSMLLRPDFKRLGDMAAGTLVIHCRPMQLHGKIPATPPVAPGRPLTAREQAAIVAWAGRASRLTPQRQEELARIATAALGVADSNAPGSATKTLMGHAHWLLGHRSGPAS